MVTPLAPNPDRQWLSDLIHRQNAPTTMSSANLLEHTIRQAPTLLDPAPVRNSDDVARNRTYTAPTPTQQSTPAPTPAQPKPASSSSGSGSGGGSGGSGGGSGGSGGSSGGSLTSMQKQMQQELDGLAADRDRAKRELMDQFALAPTKQEKDAIARQMADIERRYQEGRQMVTLAYQDASSEVGTRLSETRARKDSDMEQMLAMLEGSAQRTDEITSVAEGRDAAYGVGANIGGTDGGDAHAAEIAALAQIEAALSGQLNDVAASDQEWVANLLAAEAPAQQASLRRGAEDRSTAAQLQHDQQVQARIAAERAQQAQLLAALESDFMGRQSGLEQSLLQAEMQQQQMAQERELAMAQIAASRARGSGGPGGGDPDPTDPTLERQLQYQMLAEMDPSDQKALIALGGIDPAVASAIQGNLPYELSSDQWARARHTKANVDRHLVGAWRDRFGG